jgi:hypothetical protein
MSVEKTIETLDDILRDITQDIEIYEVQNRYQEIEEILIPRKNAIKKTRDRLNFLKYLDDQVKAWKKRKRDNYYFHPVCLKNVESDFNMFRKKWKEDPVKIEY